MDPTSVRQVVIDWLDDNYHFGDAEQVIGDDNRSFLQHGVLDSLGFVKMIVYIEETFGFKIDAKTLTPKNFDSLALIVRYITGNQDYTGTR